MEREIGYCRYTYVYRVTDSSTKGANAKAVGRMMPLSVVHIERAGRLDSSIAISPSVAGSRSLGYGHERRTRSENNSFLLRGEEKVEKQKMRARDTRNFFISRIAICSLNPLLIYSYQLTFLFHLRAR